MSRCPEQAGSSSSSCTTGFWLTPFCTNFGMVLIIFWLLTRLEGLCRQTLPFISFQGFLTGREVPGLGKQQRSAGFSQLDNPPCWAEGGNLMVWFLQTGLACGRKQSPGMLKKPLPGATAPETFHVWHHWESLHVLLLSVHLGVTSKQTEGTCLHQLWQELCGIKRNYLFSQPGLGLLLNNFFFLSQIL